MTNKKLGLLLAPLLPITAIGIVEVAGALASMNEPAKVEIVEVHHDYPVVHEIEVAPMPRFAEPVAPPATPVVPPESLPVG